MKKTISILTMFLCLFFVIIGCDSNTTINVPGLEGLPSPDDFPAVDQNVPPEDKFETADDSIISLMVDIYKTPDNPTSESGTAEYKIERLDGATFDNQPAKGYLEWKPTIGSNSYRTFSGTFKIGDIEYSTERFEVKDSYDTETHESIYVYDGVVTANGEKLNDNEAYNILNSFANAPYSQNASNIQSIYKTNQKIIYSEKFYGELSAIEKTTNSLSTASEYLKIVKDNHKMTMGRESSINYKDHSKDSTKFLYLSLDGRYFDEATFNQFMDAVNSEN